MIDGNTFGLTILYLSELTLFPRLAAGVHWFRLICAAEGADMGETFKALLHSLAGGLSKGPFNHEARAEVGLEQAW